MSNTTITKLPYVITVCEPAHTGFDKATLLIRNHGYRFSPDSVVQVFNDGVCSFVLTLGTPADAAIKAAEVAREEALVLEEMEFERRVQTAAKVLVEQAEKEKKAKELAAVRKEQEAIIKKLTAELAK